jgi:hypothetical protein
MNIRPVQLKLEVYVYAAFTVILLNCAYTIQHDR